MFIGSRNYVRKIHVRLIKTGSSHKLNHENGHFNNTLVINPMEVEIYMIKITITFSQPIWRP